MAAISTRNACLQSSPGSETSVEAAASGERTPRCAWEIGTIGIFTGMRKAQCWLNLNRKPDCPELFRVYC